jgi:putative FmdB family regulatory protein
MPLYEYKCHGCGKTFEVMQKFSDEPLKTHSEGCGGEVERLLSPPALQFKGSGWYVTDYARNNGSAKAGEKTDSGDKKPAADSSSKETAKTGSSETKSSPPPAPSSSDSK